ncbi:hypothetical protein ACFV0Y_16470 [Streptomyces sp. NPDC059569]|uniref:hypothetical protein n=1 Tax=Streptomyces sp. NPDC059569 TaxID=3346869 RepID=UPI00367A5E47
MTTLADLTGPVITLRLLLVEHPGLPAPCANLTPIYSNVLELSFHNSFADFEAWRAALNIPPAAVTHRVQGNGTTATLTARTEFAGATVEIVGYGPALREAADQDGFRAVAA